MSRFRLWLLAHGIEFECENENWFANGFKRHISITLNHRYWGVEFRIFPYKGVYTDELNKSHAEIAAEVAEGNHCD